MSVYTDDFKDEVALLYHESDLFAHEVAEKKGCSTSSVKRWARERGLAAHKDLGWARKKHARRRRKEEKPLIILLYTLKKMSIREIEKREDVTYSYAGINNILEEEGLLRTRGHGQRLSHTRRMKKSGTWEEVLHLYHEKKLPARTVARILPDVSRHQVVKIAEKAGVKRSREETARLKYDESPHPDAVRMRKRAIRAGRLRSRWPRPTTYEIAEILGVSQVTVSRDLRSDHNPYDVT